MYVWLIGPTCTEEEKRNEDEREERKRERGKRSRTNLNFHFPCYMLSQYEYMDMKF
jgi:hypothetical protein